MLFFFQKKKRKQKQQIVTMTYGQINTEFVLINQISTLSSVEQLDHHNFFLYFI